MSTTDRAARIRRELFLRAVTPGRPPTGAARQLAEAMREVSYAAGDVIFAQGEEATRLIFVVEGEIEMIAEGKDPWTFGTGSVAGVLDLNLDRPRARTTRAKTDVLVLELRGEDWWEVFEDHVEYSNGARRLVSGGHHDILLDLAPDGGFEEPAADPFGDYVPLVPSVVERLVVLRGLPYFDRASVQAVIELAERAETVRAQAGELLPPPADGGDALMVIVAGRVEIERRSEPVLRARFGRGDLVLGGGAFGSALAEYAVSALTHVVALRIKLGDLDDVCEDHPEVTRSLLRGMSMHREMIMGEREARKRRAGSVPPPPTRRPGRPF